MDVKLKIVKTKNLIKLSCNCEITIIDIALIHNNDYIIKESFTKKRFKYFGAKTYHLILELRKGKEKDLKTKLQEAIDSENYEEAQRIKELMNKK